MGGNRNGCQLIYLLQQVFISIMVVMHTLQQYSRTSGTTHISIPMVSLKYSKLKTSDQEMFYTSISPRKLSLVIQCVHCE